jgi:hypothetical protein
MAERHNSLPNKLRIIQINSKTKPRSNKNKAMIQAILAETALIIK